MRAFLVIVVALASCSKKDQAKPAPTKAVEPARPPNPPIEQKTLPPLAADPGGATGKPIWQAGFGGIGIDAARGVAVDAAGDVYTCGYFDHEIDFGATVGKKLSAGGSDAFIAKLGGADGKLLWAQTFGAKRDDTANAIAVHGEKIVVVGQFLDELKLGEFDHKAVGSDDLFVAEFDKTGAVQWLWTLGGIDSDGANTVAATPDGGWVIGGSYADAITIGAQTIKSKGKTDGLLVKLAASGDVEWVKSFGGRYDDTILHVAVDANGNIYVQGHFKDTADWGGKPLTAAGGSDNDVVLAKYDANGDHIWSQRFGNTFNDVAGGVAVDPAGHVTMVGSFENKGDISFGPGDSHTSVGEADIYVAHFTSDGKLEWAKTFGAERDDVAWGVAVDGAGNILTTGWFWNTVDFGKGIATSKGNKDVFALKLDPKGATVWAQTWGDHDHDQGRAIAVDDKANVIVAGLYRFKLALLDPPIESHRDETNPVLAKAPPPDVFVVKLAR